MHNDDLRQAGGQHGGGRAGVARLAILAGLFAALLIGVVVVWWRPATQPDVEEGRAVADEFLNQIGQGHAAQAWESTTAEFKSAEGRQSFVKYVQKHAELSKPLSFVSVQTVTVQNSPRAEYVYRSSEGKNVRLLVSSENGAWRVDRISAD